MVFSGEKEEKADQLPAAQRKEGDEINPCIGK